MEQSCRPPLPTPEGTHRAPPTLTPLKPAWLVCGLHSFGPDHRGSRRGL